MEHNYIEEIAAFQPSNEQEESDQRAILWYLSQFGDEVLTRSNVIAHLTSSGFIMNPSLDRTLMVHHNILGAWAWTGGHTDGDADLLGVAVREAKEETGVQHIAPLSPKIASLDVLWVPGHVKRGAYVSVHLHLSVGYVLICGEDEAVRVKPDENTGVRWFDVEDLKAPLVLKDDEYLYGKLAAWARRQRGG